MILCVEIYGMQSGLAQEEESYSNKDSKFFYLNPNQITSGLAQTKYIKSNLIKFINF